MESLERLRMRPLPLKSATGDVLNLVYISDASNNSIIHMFATLYATLQSPKANRDRCRPLARHAEGFFLFLILPRSLLAF